MMMSGDVHWHEGLFLQPHHLQRMQSGLNEAVAQARRLCFPYPYGVVRCRLSGDDLVNGRVRFEELHVVLPGGVAVRYPGNAELPMLNIKPRFQASADPFTVYLGVPFRSDVGANVVEADSEEAWRVKRLYRTRELEVADENTGENPVPMRVRAVNARLLLDPSETDELDAIPLLRIEHGVGEFAGVPRLDPTFIPPCLLVTGSTVLIDILRGVSNLVDAGYQDLMSRIVRAGDDRKSQAAAGENQIRLLSLSRYASRLPQLVNAPSVSPFMLYLELSALAAELSALSADSKALDLPNYNHDNPGVCFREVETRIRALLSGTGKRQYLRVAFERKEDMYNAVLTDEHFSKTKDYFLAVRTNMDTNEVVRLVQKGDRFKLMPPSLARRSAAIFGVRMEVEHAPPPVFPLQTGLTYFRLQRSSRDQLWQAIEKEKGMTVVGLSEEISQFEIALYMTLVEGEE